MKNPIRVLQVIGSMDCGGAENIIMNIYRKIDRTKIQFDFLVHTQKKCFFDDEIERLGGKIYRIPKYTGKNGDSYKKAVRDVYISHPEIHIVHGHIGSCTHIYLNEAKKCGKFTIAHSHSAKPDELNLKNILFRLFTFRTRHIADYFIGCSEKAGEYRYGKKITSDQNKYMVLKNAIDAQEFIYDISVRKDIRSEFGITDQFVMGHVGRFTHAKNHGYLLEIFKNLLKYIPDAKLMLVGGGELKDEICNKIKELNLENHIIMTGIRPDVNRLLQGMDCFVFPSFFEGLPLTAIEAQASGLPCYISSEVSSEVVVSNLAVQYSINQDADNWAKAIAKNNNMTRRDMHDCIKKAGYDIDEVVRQIEDLYFTHCKL